MFCTYLFNSSFLPSASMCEKILLLVHGQPYALASEHILQFFQEPFNGSTLTVLFTCQERKSAIFEREVYAAVAFWRLVIDEAELDYMTVNPLFRGESFGKLLLKISEQYLVLRGVQRALLEVSEKNAVARKIYEGCGYNFLGTREKYYRNGENALLMAKPL